MHRTAYILRRILRVLTLVHFLALLVGGKTVLGIGGRRAHDFPSVVMCVVVVVVVPARRRRRPAPPLAVEGLRLFAVLGRVRRRCCRGDGGRDCAFLAAAREVMSEGTDAVEIDAQENY